MEDRDLEAGLREALGATGEPSERVWRELRKPEPRWVPSLAETSLALLAGVAALAFMALPRPDEKGEPVAHQESTIEKTFVASIHTRTTLR